MLFFCRALASHSSLWGNFAGKSFDSFRFIPLQRSSSDWICQDLLRIIKEDIQSVRAIVECPLMQQWYNNYLLFAIYTDDWWRTINNGNVTLRYFTDQTMTQKIENTDPDIKLIKNFGYLYFQDLYHRYRSDLNFEHW